MKIGILPLYVKMYDKTVPQRRVRLGEFYQEVCGIFEGKGVSVEKAEICCVEEEFAKAISDFEKADVDAVVTLHLAYSPSLESINVLSKTKLPLIVLDTTLAPEFGQTQEPAQVGFNHGIHGVMDMCSMLRRYGKEYAIVAGHYIESDVIDRVCALVRAAAAAKALKSAKVALVGGKFDGMGDFLVPREEMKERFGITVDDMDPDYLAKLRSEVTKEEIAEEVKQNEAIFDFSDDIIQEEYEGAVSSCLTLRKCIENGGYTAVSANFQNVSGIGTMPFIEICKAMQRGIGYAGEGDVLTAAFTGALMSAYPETNFVEIFCPDWKNNMLFLSHMGEVNYRIIDTTPFVFPAGKVENGPRSYRACARMKAGSGVYVNISRDVDNYQLLISHAEMVAEGPDNFPRSVRGWMKPDGKTTAEFLEKHSKYGATHHSIFVYGATVEELEYFGKLLSMKTVII